MTDDFRPTRRGLLAAAPFVAAPPLLAGEGALAAPFAGGPSRAFEPRSFGALGDDAADDTAAFVAMHRAMREAQRDDDALRAADPRRPPLAFSIALGDGRYRYGWNRWTWGLRRVRVTGEEAGLRCVNPGPWHVDQFCLVSNRDHYSRETTAGPTRGGTERYGGRIRTAAPGDEAVVLIDPRDRAEFSPGAWVLVQSYAQQQYGYPPNPRHFERARVVAVEGSMVRLDRPLRHGHREDWPDDSADPAAIGAARVVAIDLPDCPLAELQVFEGLRCLENPNHSEPDAGARRTLESLTVSGCLDVRIRDCRLIALGMTQCESVRVSGCDIVYTEPDKLISLVAFDDCRIDSLQQCTGLDRLVLRDCILGSDAQTLARDVELRGCDFRGDAPTPERFFGVNLDGPTPTRRMLLSRCRFRPRRPGETGAFRGSVWIEVAVDGRDVAPGPNGTLVARGGTAARAALLDVLSEGWPLLLRRRDGKEAPARCVALRGLRDDAEITIADVEPPKIGDVLRVPRLLSLRIEDCDLGRASPDLPDPPRLDWGPAISGSRLVRARLRPDEPGPVRWPPGWPVSLRARVIRPFRDPTLVGLVTKRRSDGREIGRLALSSEGADRLIHPAAEGPFARIGFVSDLETTLVVERAVMEPPASSADHGEVAIEIVVEPPFAIDDA